MSDPIENEFITWYGNYAGNYGAPAPTPPPIPEEAPTPPPVLGFGAYATAPPLFKGYSFGSYRPSPLDPHRFATQGLETMNLSASFESVSNVPAPSPSKGKVKAKAKPKAKSKANEDDSEATIPTNRAPVAYSPEETAAIAFCWSTVSQDLRKGVDQSGLQFWKCIEIMYNTQKKPDNAIDRDAVQLRSHFSRAQTKVTQFNGFYLQCKEQWPSGSSNDDIYDAAAKMYYKKNNKQHFVLKDAWKILHELPKFQGVGSDKRQKRLDGSSNSSRSEDDAPFFSHERPIGKTAAKGKGKATANVRLPDLPEEKIVNLLDTIAEANRDFSEWAKSRLIYEKTKAIKTYVKLKEKDTSNMSPDDLEEHFNMLVMLKKSLDL